MEDDPEISSWFNQIISNQSKETPEYHSTLQNNDNYEFTIDDNDDDLDLNFFKKYRKENNAQIDEKDDNEEIDISHFFNGKYPIDIKNDTIDINTGISDDTDTLNEARRLLNSWADQTESFHPPAKPSDPNPRNKITSSPNRIAKYRKLEMPMMVAKKIPELKVNDPTLKIEERQKHLREMKEKRLERQKLKQIQVNSPPRENNRQKNSIKVPDIDSEIRNYRLRMNENVREKQKEIEEREKRMKSIENEAFANIQMSADQNDKRKEKVRPNINSINKKSSFQNKNAYEDNIRRTTQNRRSASESKPSSSQSTNNGLKVTPTNNELNIISVHNPKNATKVSNKNESKASTSQSANSDNFDEKVIQMRLQVFMKNEVIRRKRHFFARWVARCRFQTQTFRKAAVLANFRVLSKSFSLWNKRLHDKQQKRELDQLERKLRERNSKEQLVLSHFKKRQLRKFFSVWRIKYKTQVEFQIAEARKKKRLEIVALQFNNNNAQRNNNHPQQNNRENAKRIIIRHSTQPSHNFNRQANQDFANLIVTNSNSNQNHQPEQNQISPSNSPNRNNTQNQPKKVKKIKIDPKIEAMEKRSEEQRQKRMEKLQKQVDEERELKEKKEKEESEKLKKRRMEHLKELEKEKKLREDERKKQIEIEKSKERMKYITEESEKFRTKMIKLNAFREWKKILTIRNNFLITSKNFYSKKLKQKVLLSFQLNANMEEKERLLLANKVYTKHLKLNYFNYWFSVHDDIKNKEMKVASLHEKTILRIYLKKMSFIRKERKKQRFLDIQNQLRLQTLRRVFKAWPVGCAAIREDEEREEDRKRLLSKALQYLDEISSDDI